MSRLIDKLTKANRSTSQPMGFRTARADREEPKMLLIASVILSSAGLPKDSITGVDAVLLRAAKTRLSSKVIQTAIASMTDIPCGVHLEDIGTGNTDAMIRAGCDFLVFGETSPVEAMPQDEATGKILQLEPSREDSLIRVLNNAPVDAVLAGDAYQTKGTLTWNDLMSLQRLSSLLTRPLLVPVATGISSSELKAIWEADVDGVIIEPDASRPDYFEEMRKIISQLPPRTTRKYGKSEAVLPRTESARSTVTPDEEEEEEYE
jgi:hypothetical protein